MKYTFTDWKKNCLLLFLMFSFFFFLTMHPSNLDHKDMQRRGVQTFQARAGSGGSGWEEVIKLNRRDGQDEPGSISIAVRGLAK